MRVPEIWTVALSALSVGVAMLGIGTLPALSGGTAQPIPVLAGTWLLFVWGLIIADLYLL